MMNLREPVGKSFWAVKRAQAKAASWRQGRIANNFANGEYRKLVKNAGVPPLTKHVDRQILDYSHSVFRSPHFTGWLRFYAAFRGDFLEGWIPDNFFVSFALPRINQAYRSIGGSGTLARRVIGCSNLPDIAYRVGDVWFDPDWTVIAVEALQDRLFADGERVVLKCENSSRGRGVTIVDRGVFDPAWMQSTSIVAQNFISPAKVFSEISPGGLMTLRITTWYRDGQAGFAASHLRVVRAGDQFVRSSRLVVPISEAGVLYAHGYTKDWCKFSRHPDLGAPFEGFAVPGRNRAVELALEFHRSVPQFGVIGWDFLVPESGDPVLVEWNTENPAITISQASLGPCLAPLELERLASAGHTY